MNTKKLYEMSDDEVLNEVSIAIHDYLERIRPQHGEFNLKECVTRQINELKRLFRESQGLGRKDTLSPRDIQELDLFILHYLPLMQERAQSVKLRYDQEQTVWKITGTSAEAQIVAAFQEAGMKAVVERQRYRAKVSIDMGGRKLRFYVRYKTLEKEEAMPSVVQAVLDLKDAICRIGGDIRLSR